MMLIGKWVGRFLIYSLWLFAKSETMVQITTSLSGVRNSLVFRPKALLGSEATNLKAHTVFYLRSEAQVCLMMLW